MDIKVFDGSRTEVDQEAFEYLMKQPDVPVLEIFIPETTSEGKCNLVLHLTPTPSFVSPPVDTGMI